MIAEAVTGHTRRRPGKPSITSVAPKREDAGWDSIVGTVTAHDILLAG